MHRNVRDYFTRSTISNIITVFAGIALYLSLSNFDVVRTIASGTYKIISPFVAAYVIAFLLNTPVNWFQRVVFAKSKKSKGLSVTVVYILAMIIVSALVVAIGPQIKDSVLSVVGTIPKYLENLTETLNKLSLEYHWDSQVATTVTEYLTTALKAVSTIVLNLIPGLVNFSVSLGTLVVNTIMAIIASIYMLMSKEKLIFQAKKALYSCLPTKRAARTIEIGNRANYTFSKFLNGKMLDSLIIGIICFFGTLFIYSPYALLIAVIIGITNMIPFFGPFIGAVPSIFILLMVRPLSALVFLFFILILQQFDGNILGPKILGDSTGLSALWVLVAIVVGGGLFGFVGMLIGVPTFAVIYSLIAENMDKKLANKNIDVNQETFEIKPSEKVER